MRLGPSHGDGSTEGGVGGGTWLSGGADFQSVAPKVSSLLDRLQTGRTHLLQIWSDKKLHLDQGLQLHLFEQDATKVSAMTSQTSKQTFCILMLSEALLHANPERLSNEPLLLLLPCLRCQSGSPTVKSCFCRASQRSGKTTSTLLTYKRNTSTSPLTAWSV